MVACVIHLRASLQEMPTNLIRKHVFGDCTFKMTTISPKRNPWVKGTYAHLQSSIYLTSGIPSMKKLLTLWYWNDEFVFASISASWLPHSAILTEALQTVHKKGLAYTCNSNRKYCDWNIPGGVGQYHRCWCPGSCVDITFEDIVLAL